MRVVLLPGDCIGPEITREARRVLEHLAPDVTLEERPFGGAAIRGSGSPLPQETLAACLAADAVLKGPIGDPQFDAADVRPEQGLLALRKALNVYANLRPARAPGIDVMIVRELVGGLYFGTKGTRPDGTVFDTCEYHPDQVERIGRRAFELARARGRRVVSVDKANVLETSRMWRRVMNRLAAEEYPDVALEHLLVDNAAMQLVRSPQAFDVLVTENTFGDILSDIAAEVTGGLGLAGSASLGDGRTGLFEPVHGSAPDIAGHGVANPVGMLRSTALLLEHGLGRPAEARQLEEAVDAAMAAAPTADLGGTATTSAFGDAVLDALRLRAQPAPAPA
jgi:3-isopropylmalate dehydrogenase